MKMKQIEFFLIEITRNYFISLKIGSIYGLNKLQNNHRDEPYSSFWPGCPRDKLSKT
jgi:hypothetical protein